jgi:hypothetical protein
MQANLIRHRRSGKVHLARQGRPVCMSLTERFRPELYETFTGMAESITCGQCEWVLSDAPGTLNSLVRRGVLKR